MNVRNTVVLALVGSAVLATLSGCSAPLDTPTAEPMVATPDISGEAWQRFAEEEWTKVVERHPDAVRPDAELLRTVTDREWATVIVECMQEAGFEGFKDTGGGSLISGEFHPDELESMDIAMWECKVSYPRATDGQQSD